MVAVKNQTKQSSARLLPFDIDRNFNAALGEQVADGLRKCILSGFYKEGDILPSLGDLVEALGISQRVARDGIQRIVAEGLAVVRPRSGCRVLHRDEPSVRGRVLGIFSDKQRVSYYYMTLIPEIERILKTARYAFEALYVPVSANGSRDVSAIANAIRSPFNLVVSLYAPEQIERLLFHTKIPYIPIGSPRGNASAAIRFKKDVSFATEFAERCVALGVKTAWVATYATCETRMALKDALESLGIDVEWNRIPPHAGFGYLEKIERSGFEDALRRLSGQKTFPDVMVAMDDYYLRGLLAAIASLALRIPSDIRVAGLVNEGARPSSPVSLACFAVDARRDADGIASAILSYLGGCNALSSCYSRLAFHDGPSLG